MARGASRVDVVGPLEPYRAGFEAVLADAGYAPLSAANQVRLMRHVSIWLEAYGLEAVDLAPAVVQEYLAFRRGDGYTCWLSLRGLTPLLTYLRVLGVAPESASSGLSGPLDVLLERYRRYLAGERGLVPATVRYYVADAKLFLRGWVDASGSRLDKLDAAGVTEFVVGECARRSVGSAKIMVTVLRSLLRFLLLDGVAPVDLSGVVPAVAGWRGSHLPKGMSPTKVQALLASCQSPRLAPGRPCQGVGERARLGQLRDAGRRDLAIVLLLVRLGLRAVEVARLRLDDLDWRRGEVVIWTIGARQGVVRQRAGAVLADNARSGEANGSECCPPGRGRGRERSPFASYGR